MSDLESQYEKEMEDSNEAETEAETDLEQDFEIAMEDSNEAETEAETDLEQDFEIAMEDSNEAETEAETDLEQDFEIAMEDSNEAETEFDLNGSLADRFYELASREFESSNELDSQLNEIMDEVERQYFFKKLLKKKGLGKFINLGKKFVKGMPAFKNINVITQLARGNLKGALSSLAKTAIPTLFPGAAIGMQALNALTSKENTENDLEKWKNFVKLSELSYESLIDNFNESAIRNPISANTLANQSFQKGISRLRNTRQNKYNQIKRRSTRVRKYRLRIRKGDKVILRIEGL